MKFCWHLALTLLALCGASPVFAQAPVTVTLDENGHGFIDGVIVGPLSFTAPPLTYLLPYTAVPGDVVLLEPGTGGISDVIRFAGNTATFFSELPELGEVPELADVGLPTDFSTNVVRIPEVGSEGNNGALYMPGPSDPGAIISAAGLPVLYNFISDAEAVPEPSALVLLATGTGLLGVLGWQRRRRNAA